MDNDKYIMYLIDHIKLLKKEINDHNERHELSWEIVKNLEKMAFGEQQTFKLGKPSQKYQDWVRKQCEWFDGGDKVRETRAEIKELVEGIKNEDSCG